MSEGKAKIQPYFRFYYCGILLAPFQREYLIFSKNYDCSHVNYILKLKKTDKLFISNIIKYNLSRKLAKFFCDNVTTFRSGCRNLTISNIELFVTVVKGLQLHLRCGRVLAIIFIFFLGFLMAEQVFLSPQVKRKVIISNRLVYTRWQTN